MGNIYKTDYEKVQETIESLEALSTLTKQNITLQEYTVDEAASKSEKKLIEISKSIIECSEAFSALIEATVVYLKTTCKSFQDNDLAYAKDIKEDLG